MARLKGSSLVEATTALALLTVALGLAWMSFGHLLTNDQTIHEFHAALLLRQRAVQIEREGAWQENHWDTLGYRITHQTELLDEVQQLYQLTLHCETPGGEVFDYQVLKTIPR